MKIINNIFISLMACVLVLSVMSMAYTMPPLTVLGNLTLDNGALPSKITGGVSNSDNLYLTSTSAATKGKIYLGSDSVYDEVNKRLGVGTTSPAVPLYVVGAAVITGHVSTSSSFVSPTSVSPSIPGYRFSGSTDTGMYSRFADTLAFSTSGTERLNLSSSGVSSPLPLMLGAVGEPTAPAGSDIKIYAQNGVPYYRNATGSYIISGGTVTGGVGDVVGPASSTADNFPSFTDITGKTLKDSGKSAASFADASDTTDALALKAASSDLWTKINKSGDTMSGPLAMGSQKVTGLLNGTASQDVVTYSQLDQIDKPGSFDYIIEYSSARSRAEVSDRTGQLIYYGSNDTAIQTALNRGGKVVLASYFVGLSTTLIMNKTTHLEGLGYHTGINSSANPAVQTDANPLHYVHLNDLKIGTGTANVAFNMTKTATAFPVPQGSFERVWFYSKPGTTTGAAQWESAVSYGIVFDDCIFNTSQVGTDAVWGGISRGINLKGNASAGTTAIEVKSCHFYGLKYPIYALGANAHLEDIRFHDNEVMGCYYGPYFKGVVEPIVHHNNIDNVYAQCLVLNSVQEPKIDNNHMHNRHAGSNVIEVLDTIGATYHGTILFNELGSYASPPTNSAGITIIASNTGIYNNIIQGNTFYNLDYGIFSSTSGGKTITNTLVALNQYDEIDTYAVVLGAGSNSNVVLYPTYRNCGNTIANSGTSNLKNADTQAL